MTPAQLAAVLDAAVRRDAPRPIEGVTHDSRSVRPGSLFCCVRGANADGHDFAGGAVRDGAAALLVDHELDLEVAQIVVRDVRAAMAPASAAVYGHPSREVAVLGVTGTNGKTTVVHMLRAIFGATGVEIETIGTLTGARTTPEAPELQARLAEARDRGVSVVAMEVSSHALAQHRADAIRFRAAGFTNLSPDHLDFHGTLEQYFEAKARLFEAGRADRAVICVDDDAGRTMQERARANGLDVDAVSVSDLAGLRLSPTGSSFTLNGHEVVLAVPGRFNVANALVAAGLARAAGVADASIAAGLGTATSAPGRVEVVDAGQPFAVLVDYAHTPDGLEAVLRMARETSEGRVIVVFGCGGDRDTSKRPAMGRIATELADVAVLTTDNPRSEDPRQIASDVVAGIERAERLVLELDRERAIEVAVTQARANDVVIIAGKGHETTQVFADHEVEFDDRAAARAALASQGFTAT